MTEKIAIKTIIFLLTFALAAAFIFAIVTVADFSYIPVFAEEEADEEASEGEDYDCEDDLPPNIKLGELVCEHAECALEGEWFPGGLAVVTVNKFEKGYALDAVLVSCDGEIVTTSRKGNEVSFVVPDGESVSVRVIFKESVTPEVKKSILGTKEIIAISVAGGILVCGGVFIFIKNRKKQ